MSSPSGKSNNSCPPIVHSKKNALPLTAYRLDSLYSVNSICKGNLFNQYNKKRKRKRVYSDFYCKNRNWVRLKQLTLAALDLIIVHSSNGNLRRPKLLHFLVRLCMYKGVPVWEYPYPALP